MSDLADAIIVFGTLIFALLFVTNVVAWAIYNSWWHAKQAYYRRRERRGPGASTGRLGRVMDHYHHRDSEAKVVWEAEVIHEAFPDVVHGGIAALLWAGFYRCRSWCKRP